MDWKALTKLDEEEESNIQEVTKYFSLISFKDLYKRGHLKRYINPDSKQDLDFISTKHIDESKIHEIENNPTET